MLSLAPGTQASELLPHNASPKVEILPASLLDSVADSILHSMHLFAIAWNTPFDGHLTEITALMAINQGEIVRQTISWALHQQNKNPGEDPQRAHHVAT